MCGICGVWGGSDGSNVAAMVSAMRHRGPDDSGVFSDDNVAMGMARLAIIDTTACGHQPMFNEEKTIGIVYNGELYNFRAERELLYRKGYTFHSTSDTEVVLRMYEHYGDDFLLRMRGMFALALYDRRQGKGRERFLLARDHLGIKPLVYAQIGAKIVFASEIKSLLASKMVKPMIDPDSLRLLLTFGSVTQPATILSGVKMLLPGHRLIIEGTRVRIQRYWNLEANRYEGIRLEPYEVQVDHLRRLLEENVRIQMESDVPLGAFLSGGVDSSLLVALMAKMSERKIKTYSVGFGKEGGGIDESDEAEKIARFIGTDHTRVEVSGKDVRNCISHVAGSLDQPSVDGVNSYFVSLAARRDVTVAISGTGGDELFAGYPWFKNMVLFAHEDQQHPYSSWLRGKMGQVASQDIFNKCVLGRQNQRLEQIRARGGFLPEFARQHYIFGVAGAARTLSAEMRDAARVGREMARDMEGADELRFAEPLARVSALCLRGYTQNQLLRDIDAVSMAHSLEVRVPFLDPVLTDFALSLSAHAKLGDVAMIRNPEAETYRAMGTKRILIDAGKGLLPDDIDLQVKRGFSMPFAAWLKAPLREVLEDSLAKESILRRGLFDVQEVERIKSNFLTAGGSWALPWLLMMTELWCREVIDEANG